jgi:hypothetical protein
MLPGGLFTTPRRNMHSLTADPVARLCFYINLPVSTLSKLSHNLTNSMALAVRSNHHHHHHIFHRSEAFNPDGVVLKLINIQEMAQHGLGWNVHLSRHGHFAPLTPSMGWKHEGLE